MSAASGRPRSPTTGAGHDIALLDRSVEEVVGGQEHEAAAAIPEARHDVELVLSHVFVVPGKDDQVVRLREPASGRRRSVQVRVGQIVDVAVGRNQPPQERLLIMLVVRDDASVLVRAPEASMRLARVPRVEGAVSVIVVEVVRLPCHRREDDGDVILAERPRTENERRVADLAAACDELARRRARSATQRFESGSCVPVQQLRGAEWRLRRFRA